MVEEAKFFAWLDGELPPEEAADVERKVAADPELSRLADEHRAMAAGLRGAFDGVAGAPVPLRLREAVRAKPRNVIDVAGRRTATAVPVLRPLPRWAAMAATLAFGIAVGTIVAGDFGTAPVEVRDGQLYAAGSLDEALDARLASAPETSGVRIGLTFRNQGGAVCRSFVGAEASGLACRDGGRWRVRGLFEAPEGQSGEYRMAAGTDPNLAALIDSTMAGEPFGARQERSARQNDWR